MTTTLNGVAKKKADEQSAEQQAAVELVRMAKEQGLSLTGPDGLLTQLTKTVLETSLNEEMTEHLGDEKHDPASAGTGNIRNGTRPETVLTENTGQVEIDVPRDRAGTFEPQIVKKRQRRLNGVDEVVLSLYAKGLTTGEISEVAACAGRSVMWTVAPDPARRTVATRVRRSRRCGRPCTGCRSTPSRRAPRPA